MEISELVKTLEYFFEHFGYLAIFAGSMIEMSPLGWLVPGGTVLAVAGFFANGKEITNLILTLLFGTIGAWLAFLLSYLLGKKSGMWLVAKLRQKKNAAFAKRLLENHGAVILTTSMMANMTRFWVAYIAGVEDYVSSKFLLYSLIASFGWTTLMVFAGYLAGYERGNLEHAIGSIGIVGWVILGVALFIIQRSIKHEYKHYKEDLPHNENSQK